MSQTSFNHNETKITVKRILALTPYILVVAVVVLLGMNIPTQTLLSTYATELMIYAFLTALALFFSSRLTEGTLSPAHVVGMMAFLSLPQDAYPIALWAVFLGTIVGSGLFYSQRHAQYQTHNPNVAIHWSQVIFLAGRVIISFAVAGEIYLRADGALPLTTVAWNDGIAPLLALYCFIYVTLYLAIFLLESYTKERSIQQMVENDFLQILVILVLPVPFAILSAEVSSQLSTSSEIINITGVILIIVGLYALTRSEQRLRKQLNELRTLSVVTRAMRAHLNMDTLLKTVYLQVSHLLHVENFTVVLEDPDETTLEFPLIVRDGSEDEATPPEDRKAHYDDGLIKHVMKHGTPLLISQDVAEKVQSMGIAPLRDYYHSWVGVPLLAGGKTLGMIGVFSTNNKRVFTQDDLRLLNIVASSASIAIENAQLYRQQTERVNQMGILNNIASLLSGTLSPNSVVDTIISSASVISRANAVSMYLTWEDGLISMRYAGLNDDFGEKLPEPMLLTTEMPERYLPLAINDIQSSSMPEISKKRVQTEAMRAVVELPLVVGDSDFGILTLYFDEKQTFNGEKLEVLRSFATQAAQAIKNARTYASTDEAFQRSVERLLSLASAGSLLASTVEIQKICQLVLGHAIETTYADGGLVALYGAEDNNDTTLQTLAVENYNSSDFVKPATIKAFIGEDTLITDQPYIIGESSPVSPKMNDDKHARSQLSVPIHKGDSVLGFIVLQSETENKFNDEDAHFAAQIATQTVIAIDNARLFHSITEARDRLQVILDAMDEALMLINAKGKVALANPRMKLLGLKPSTLINQDLSTLLKAEDSLIYKQLGFDSPEDALEVVEDLKTRNNWKGYTPHMYTVHTEQSTVYVQRYMIPVRDGNDHVMGALMVFYNKTEEQELNNARNQLSRMIVHDLRSPLTAVTTSIKLLRELVPEESEYWSIVDTTTDASQRAIRKLLSRVDSLLDISKMESGRMTLDQDITELPNLADSVCIELSPLAHELEVKIVSEIEEDVPLLNIDSDKIERLLLNLVDNALKYTPADTTITIRSYPVGQNGAENGFVRIDVIDEGPGVPEDYKETLFDSFVQVAGRKKVRRGVGLGLTFCKLVTEAHGGRIWIEDNTPTGSIFSFTLPVANTARLPEDTGEFPIGDF